MDTHRRIEATRRLGGWEGDSARDLVDRLEGLAGWPRILGSHPRAEIHSVRPG